MMEDYTQRFTGRAEAYSSYRPTYPKQFLDILNKEANFDSTKIVADIGSGTGILSKLFLENGNRVFSVEPNDDMRSVAGSNLGHFQRFASIKGTAENTTLEDRSVDLISVGQALHWFDSKRSWKEFSRIIKRGGYLCILYNDRKTDDASGIMQRVEDDILSKFFSGWSFKKFSISNEQVLDFEGLVGRVCSASYMPQQNQQGFSEVKRELKDMFSKYQKDNKIMLSYETNIFLGLL